MTRDDQQADCRPPRSGPPTAATSLAWMTAVELAILVGWLCAVTTWGWQTPVACGLAIAVLGAGFGSIGWWGIHPLDAAGPVLRLGSLAGMLTVAVAGLVTVLGVLGSVAVLVLALTHPWVRGRIGRVVPYREAALWRGDLSRVPDEALWQAWRRTGARLAVTGPVAARAALVRQREEYLDELLRRHPHVVSTWFTGSGT